MVINLLIYFGIDVKGRLTLGSTYLIEAVISRQTESVKALIRAGADINAQRDDGMTALDIAANEGFTDIVTILLDTAARAACIEFRESFCGTLLKNITKYRINHFMITINAKAKGEASIFSSMVVNFEHVTQLLDNSEDTSQRNNAVSTALYFAASRGHADVVKLLLSRGADVNSMKDSTSCLQLAARIGHTDVVSALVSDGADVNVKDNGGISPLHEASCNGHIGVVMALLDNNAHVDIRSIHGLTPLLRAADQGHTDVVELLLDKCADVNSVTNENVSCLIRAAFNGHVKVVRALVSAGADVNLQANDGASALHAASDRGHVDVVKMLLDNDAHVNIRTIHGMTPLFCAVDQGHTDVVELLLAVGADVNSITKNNESCLIRAAAKGHVDVVRALVSAGADVNLQNIDGFSALHLASVSGHVDDVKALLDNDAFIEERTTDGRTPLYLAAINGQTEVIDVLATRGADFDAIDYNRVSPLDAAIRDRQTDAIKKLRQHKAVIAYVGLTADIPAFSWYLKIFKGREEELSSLFTSFSVSVQNIIGKSWKSTLKNMLPFVISRDSEHPRFDEFLCAFLETQMTKDDVSQFMKQVMVLFGPSLDGQYEDFLAELCDALQSRNCDNISMIDIISYTSGLSADNAECISFITTSMITKALEHLNLSCSDYTLFTNDPAKSHCHTTVNSAATLKEMRSSLENGADIEEENIDGLRKIHYAARIGNVELVKLLIQYGSNVNAADVFGNRPLHEAVCRGLDGVQLLVQHGAKLNVQNIDGKTPLHIAIERQRSDAIMFLLRHDADVRLTDVWRNTPLHYVTSGLCERLEVRGFGEYFAEYLIKKRQCLVIRNIVGVSVLEHFTAHVTPVITSAVYCRQGPPLLTKTVFVDCHGNTALHHAVGVYAKLKMFKLSDVSEVVDFLVKHGADINAQNNAGLTPLHVARGTPAIKACLQHADCTITDKQGRNFWHLLFILRNVHDSSEVPSDIWHMTVASNGKESGDNFSRSPLHYACMHESRHTPLQSSRFAKDFISRFRLMMHTSTIKINLVELLCTMRQLSAIRN